ncbi:MAG: RNA polymerase sigma factor [Rubrivivax sp.]|nr:RNA polymerase sigma factor [Rubrivivax sp.]
MMFFAPQRRARTPAPDDASVDAEGAAARLLQRLVGGDLEALESLYRRESGRVYRYALALCGNAAWAADATQEAFVALATRPQGFDPARGQIGAYLAGVARHALAARWRELRREEPLVDIDAAAPADAGAPDMPASAAGAHHPELAASPEALLVRTQELQALWAALRALPMVFREAVVLVDLQERPYAEAAQIAGIELNTLRTRLHRARARLAALLGAGGSPDLPGTRP